jgi:hypothetical protein
LSKPDETPPDHPPRELVPSRSFDGPRLIAGVRRGDEALIAEAYRVTFGNELGRTVLLHALGFVGRVAHPRDVMTEAQANWANGRAAAVLEIAGLAGFDPVAVAAAGLTQTLEGERHDRPDQPRDRDPGDAFGEAGFVGGADDAAEDWRAEAGPDAGGFAR